MQEIEARATFSQQQLQIVKSQMAAKQRDIRLLQLTSKELDTLPKSTRVYEGVGKMYGGSLILPPIIHVEWLRGRAVAWFDGAFLQCDGLFFFPCTRTIQLHDIFASEDNHRFWLPWGIGLIV